MRYRCTPPLLPRNCFNRHALFAILEESKHKPLTLIQGGPATGKSILLHDWLHTQKHPFFWYVADLQDSEPLAFLRNLLTGLQYIYPNAQFESSPLLDALDEHSGSLKGFVSTLSDDFLRNFEHPLFLVLDESHHIYNTPQNSRLLADFVRFLPENIHLILSGHPATVPDLMMLQVQGYMVEITPEQLCFNAQEIIDYAAQLELALNEEEAHALYDKTQGWVGGICLLLQLLKRQPHLPVTHWLERRESDTLLYDFFLQEWLANRPQAMRHFLLKTAFFPIIQNDLCQQIFEDTQAEKWLEQLFSYQLFAYPIQGRGMVYHPAFRTYLQNEFRRSVSLREQKQFFGHLAMALENNFPEEALQMYLEAKDYPSVENMLTRLRETWLQSHRYGYIQTILEHIPESYRHQNTKLQVYLADIMRLKGDMTQAEYLLSQAENTSLTRLYQGAVACQKGLFTEALLAIDDQQTDTLDLPSEAFKYNLIGVCYLMLGDATSSLPAFKHAYTSYAKLNDKVNQAKVMHNEGLTLTWTGQLKEARDAYQLSMQLLKERQSVIPPMTEHNLALVEMYLGRFNEAQVLLEHAHEAAQKLGQKTEQVYTLCTLGRLYTQLQNFPTAAAFLERAHAFVQQERNPLLELNYHLIQIEYYCALGQLARARQLLESMKASMPATSASPKYLELLMKRGELELLSDNLPQAEQLLIEAEQLLSQCHYQYHLARVAFLLAQLYQKRDVSKKSDYFRQKALQLCQTYDYKQLQQTFIQTCEPLIETSPAPLPSFRFQFFGQMRGYQGEQLLPAARWKGKKTRLLLAILLQEKNGIDRRQLTDYLYPEQDANRTAVNAVIARLRKALEPLENQSSHFIIFADGIYRFNPAANIEVDTQAFEYYLNQAREAPAQSLKQIEFLQQALMQYNGEYLREFGSLYWVQLEQEHYRRKVRDAYQLLLDAYTARQQFKEVVQWADRCLKTDSCFEEAHLAKLCALEKLSHRRGVVKHYERMCHIFEKELDLSPPIAATAIYNRLTMRG